MVDVLSNLPQPKLRLEGGWYRVRIDVLDNNTAFLGYSKTDLLATVNGFVGGVPIDKNHPFSDWVAGEVWLVGSIVNTTVNIVVWPSSVSSI